MKRGEFPAVTRALVARLESLPGIGVKRAGRIAIWMLGGRRSVAGDSAEAIRKAEAGMTAFGRRGLF